MHLFMKCLFKAIEEQMKAFQVAGGTNAIRWRFYAALSLHYTLRFKDRELFVLWDEMQSICRKPSHNLNMHVHTS